MCSTENKETKLGKGRDPSEYRTREDGTKGSRRIKSQKISAKACIRTKMGNFKGFIICEFASAWTIGRKIAKYEQDGKGRKTKKNEEKQGDHGISNSLL